MKRNRRYIEVIATLLLATLFSASAIPISHAAKKPKSAGRTSNTISNTILNGSGNYQTLQVGADDYRAQEFPDGTPVTATTYFLKILQS